jgi:hypothetical protein
MLFEPGRPGKIWPLYKVHKIPETKNYAGDK